MRQSQRAHLRRVMILLALTTWVAAAGCSLSAAPRTDNQSVTGAPVVRIVSPIPNATYLEGVSVNVQALITNAGEDIARVEVAVDDVIIDSAANPNAAGALSFSITRSWTAAGPGAHSASVTAFRADGTASDPANVSFTVVATSGISESENTQAPPATTAPDVIAPTSAPPTVQANATNTRIRPTIAPLNIPGTGGSGALPTSALPPTTPPTTAPTQPSVPIARFTQGINVRSGPGTIFNPPIGSFAAGQTAEIVAVNPAGDWYKVVYYNTQGWVFGGLLTVEGDISSLPRDPGPPPPTQTPIPPTLPPVTAPPAGPTTAPASGNADLVVGIILLNPDPPVCGQAMEIQLDVANLGTEPTASGGTISVIDRHVATGTTQATTVGGFGVIQPGQTIRIGGIFLTVSTYYNEAHEIVITLDPDNVVPESNNSNNTGTKPYTLQQGGCG